VAGYCDYLLNRDYIAHLRAVADAAIPKLHFQQAFFQRLGRHGHHLAVFCLVSRCGVPDIRRPTCIAQVFCWSSEGTPYKETRRSGKFRLIDPRLVLL